MKPLTRSDTKREYERRRREALALREKRADARARREGEMSASLARYARRARLLCGIAEGADLVFHMSPKLAIEPYARAVRRMTELPLVRPIESWIPHGKGRDALFRSLARHLLAQYPVPALLWEGFFDVDAPVLAPLVAHVAKGGSLFDYVNATGFPVPLTRRMCHALLAMPSGDSLLAAIRRVEVRFAGGDDRLYQTWLATAQGHSLGTRDEETFWLAVLGWMAKAEGLDRNRVGPLADYLGHRRRQDAAFSLAGRSLAAVTRDMEEWHAALAAEKGVRDEVFHRSGYLPIEIDRSTDGERRVWRVEEVRSSGQLAEEGRRMNHCVYSYLRHIVSGQTSIWTMTYEDGRGPTGRWAMVTIEVRRDLASVVQARGRFNRAATSEEKGILAMWAARNNLQVSVA
jgi:hypothetical protein